MKPNGIVEAIDAHAGVCYGWDGYSGCVEEWAAWYRGWLCYAQKLVVGDGGDANGVANKFGIGERGIYPIETIGGSGSDAEYTLKVEHGYLYWKAANDTTIYILSGHEMIYAAMDAPEYEYDESIDIKKEIDAWEQQKREEADAELDAAREKVRVVSDHNCCEYCIYKGHGQWDCEMGDRIFPLVEGDHCVACGKLLVKAEVQDD